MYCSSCLKKWDGGKAPGCLVALAEKIVKEAGDGR